MAPLAKLLEEPAVEAEPSNEDKLAAVAAENAQLRQEAQVREAQSKSSTDARLEQMERMVGKQFGKRQEAPTAPQASEAYQAQQELGLTDEQILANPAAAVRAISENIASNKLGQYNQQVGQVLGEVVKRGYKGEINTLRTHPYFDDLEDELREYFEDNPGDTIYEGRVESKFHELIGKHSARLQRLAAEREANKAVDAPLVDPQEVPSRRRSIEPAIRPPSPAGPRKSGKEAAPKLDPVRKELMDVFNAIGGTNMDEAEWSAIEEGKLLPKKVSADIQIGRSAPNVEY